MAIKVFITLGLVSLPRVSYRGTEMQEQDPHASSVITHSGRFIIYSPTHEPCPCFQPRKKLHLFQGTDPKAKCIQTQQHMCISIQQKKKKFMKDQITHLAPITYWFFRCGIHLKESLPQGFRSARDLNQQLFVLPLLPHMSSTYTCKNKGRNK